MFLAALTGAACGANDTAAPVLRGNDLEGLRVEPDLATVDVVVPCVSRQSSSHEFKRAKAAVKDGL